MPAENAVGYALAHPESSVLAHPEKLAPTQNRRSVFLIFCNFVLNTLDENPDFLNEVLWLDECKFSRQDTINTQHTHYWSLKNPHLIRPNRNQVLWLVNVQCGVWKSTLKGSMYFDEPLTSESYTEILSGSLAKFLEDEVSLRELLRMWYQHDGAPKHKSAQQ
ncbi:uncharacterized protein TNCV_4214451 [Trichonephila clavipes]|nr:uncharacterized protein TNCV_4214451 [Trichonephila clavipes]